jgi:asparagine synthase (glutamine-hydrolysing)
MIYNYRDLRRELEGYGHTFTGESDTEVLLSAWRHWGDAALSRLRGMFAFAIWDATQQRLWLARDRMGEKPLYVTQQPNRLLFASELRVLLASDVVPRVLGQDGVDSYLAWGSVSQPNTVIRDVERIGAGQVACYTDGNLTVRTYWSLSDVHESSHASDRPPMEIVRGAIDEAIDQCMTADVPVGLLLSGGVDSTAILARLRALGHQHVSTFSVVFDGVDRAFSEQEWSDRAAHRFRSHHNTIVITTDRVRQLVPEAMGAMDTPSKDGVNHYLVLQAIARSGFKVAITGQGADELFFGYGNHRIYDVSRRLAHVTLPLQLRRHLQRVASKRWPDQERLRKVLTLIEPGDAERLAYLARHIVFLPAEIEQLRGAGRSWPTRHVTRPEGATSLDRLYRMEATNLLPDQLMRDGDQMSMARSLELRAPFVDHRLVETVAAIPAVSKVVPGRQKPLLVDVIGDSLVHEISQRPKVGFEMPIRRWVNEELPEYQIDATRLGMDAQVVGHIVDEGRRGVGFMRYWTLLVLHEWMRHNQVTAA